MSDTQEDGKKAKSNNALPIWGSESTMNLNSLILTNIQSSTYFKVSLFKLKTYHEVIDEIYYEVKHMEPWEKGSRKTGQTGMCGGVRGVGAGGIVSSAFCLLYKLFTLRLTRKQLNGLLNHTDSPYIRALGFMYIRYTQPPADLFDWYEEYLQDEEEIDVKAGGGHSITIGQMLVQFLTKLDWCSTLFPRIPVPIQKQIQSKLDEYAREYGTTVELMSGCSTNNQKYGHNRMAQEKGRGQYDNRSGDSGRYRERSRSPARGGYGNSTRSHEASSSRRSDDRDWDDGYRSSTASHRKRY